MLYLTRTQELYPDPSLFRRGFQFVAMVVGKSQQSV